jgi:hypothetical protein
MPSPNLRNDDDEMTGMKEFEGILVGKRECDDFSKRKAKRRLG